MGYLREGMAAAFFVRTTDEQDKEAMRLLTIFKRTKKKRIKRKIANRVDRMVAMDE